MKTLLKALLIAGLFISTHAAVTGPDNADLRSYAPAKLELGKVWDCYYFGKSYGQVGAFNRDAAAQNCKKYFEPILMSSLPAGRCSENAPTLSPFPYTLSIQFTFAESGNCANSVITRSAGLSFSAVAAPDSKEYVCPPEDPKYFEYLLKGDANGTPVCFKRLPPLDCSGLKGLSTNSGDRYVTNKGVYSSANKPSCATKCALDANGKKQCGDCKVVAKSWVWNGTTGKDIWSPMVGTFTGAACADSEYTKPPPEPPKCWKTQNNLNMCQQDPSEKCVTINGVQQCESGCGFINGDFFCADKPNVPKEPNKDNDKPLPEVDDNIQNPEKLLADMVKGDFKDVQRGVESRLSVVSTGIGNLENSVDTSNGILTDIEENTAQALADNQTEIGLLGDIKDALTENGDCDPQTDPDCADDSCDPSKSNCDDFDTGSPKSWWNSKYPDGLQTLFADKKASFMASDAYQAMTGDGIPDSGGGATQWQICLPFGFADYGCHTLEISPAIWAFIRACILFGAAILCRRMLIGA